MTELQAAYLFDLIIVVSEAGCIISGFIAGVLLAKGLDI